MPLSGCLAAFSQYQCFYLCTCFDDGYSTADVRMLGCKSTASHFMKCEHDKAHDKLSSATLKHLAGLLDAQLQQQGVKSQARREEICGRFLFQAVVPSFNQIGEANDPSPVQGS